MHCLLHGDNHTHVTDDCHVLKKQAQQLRRDREGNDKKPGYKNKTWKRDADQKTKANKQELAAFVRQEARKELNAFNKKRKPSDTEESTDDGSMASLNNVEALVDTEDGEVDDIDLAGFNYGDMDNLKVDSDDDGISV